MSESSCVKNEKRVEAHSLAVQTELGSSYMPRVSNQRTQLYSIAPAESCPSSYPIEFFDNMQLHAHAPQVSGCRAG